MWGVFFHCPKNLLLFRGACVTLVAIVTGQIVIMLNRRQWLLAATSRAFVRVLEFTQLLQLALLLVFAHGFVLLGFRGCRHGRACGGSDALFEMVSVLGKLLEDKFVEFDQRAITKLVHVQFELVVVSGLTKTERVSKIVQS